MCVGRLLADTTCRVFELVLFYSYKMDDGMGRVIHSHTLGAYFILKAADIIRR